MVCVGSQPFRDTISSGPSFILLRKRMCSIRLLALCCLGMNTVADHASKLSCCSLPLEYTGWYASCLSLPDLIKGGHELLCDQKVQRKVCHAKEGRVWRKP